MSRGYLEKAADGSTFVAACLDKWNAVGSLTAQAQLLLCAAAIVVSTSGADESLLTEALEQTSLDEWLNLGALLTEHLAESADRLHLAASDLDLCLDHKPRRTQVGTMECASVGSFDVALEWDRFNPEASSAAGTWSMPGFRIIFSRNRKTVAFILIEFADGGKEWSFRGMKVEEAERGRGFSKMCLKVWLLLAWKVRNP